MLEGLTRRVCTPAAGHAQACSAVDRWTDDSWHQAVAAASQRRIVQQVSGLQCIRSPRLHPR
eukprot:1993399-Rhodomonas_salina.3